MVLTRRARPEDVEEIINLANLVFRPRSSGLTPSMGLQYPFFLSAQNAENLFVAEDGGRIVAHNGIMKNTVQINGHKISMASMGAVCTHPDYRGQGIATQLLLEVLSALRDEGIALLTISGDRGLYMRNGADYTSLKKTFVLTRDSDKAEAVKSQCELPEALAIVYHQKTIGTIADEMAELYQKEPVRYSRPKWQFPTLIKAAPGVNDVPYPPYMAAGTLRIGGCLTAYVLGYIKESKFQVMEYAGERLAVGRLLHQLLTDLEVDKVTVDVPAHDCQLTAYLEACGHRGEPKPYPFTFVVTNAETLWNQVQPVIQERIRISGLKARLKAGLDDSLGEPSDQQANDDLARSQGKPPVDMEDGKALLHFLFDVENRMKYGEPWDSVLPLPLPWPGGLNYI